MSGQCCAELGTGGGRVVYCILAGGHLGYHKSDYGDAWGTPPPAQRDPAGPTDGGG